MPSRRVLQVLRKVGPVTQVASATHHGQVDAGPPALHLHGQDIHLLVVIAQAAAVHALLVQHTRQGGDLIADLRSLLELEHLGVGHHALLQAVEHLLRAAEQKGFRVGDVAGVGLDVHQAHARAGTAPDLVQQAGPGAVGEDRVFAGAQPESLLDELDGFLDRPGPRVGAEIAVPAIHGTPVVRHTRIALRRARFLVYPSSRLGAGSAAGRAGDLQIGVALVVPKKDVEPRAQGLDEVVLQQQGFGLVTDDRGLQAVDPRHHDANTRAAVVLLEVAGNALAEIARLADVEHRTLDVKVAVHAGQAGQGGHLFEQALARCCFGQCGRGVGQGGQGWGARWCEGPRTAPERDAVRACSRLSIFVS